MVERRLKIRLRFWVMFLIIGHLMDSEFPVAAVPVPGVHHTFHD